MSRAERIRDTLTKAFQPLALTVEDQSHQHAGHAGMRPEGETHYRVELVAETFRGKGRVEAHRLVNAALRSEFDTGLHALALTAKAP